MPTKTQHIVAISLLISAFGPGAALATAGNRVMVEERVKELSELNQQLLEQEELPRDGKLELKAEARYLQDGSINLQVYSRKFSTIDEKPITFDGQQTRMPAQ